VSSTTWLGIIATKTAVVYDYVSNPVCMTRSRMLMDRSCVRMAIDRVAMLQVGGIRAARDRRALDVSRRSPRELPDQIRLRLPKQR